ncbi:MAG: type IV pilus assembly protein PilM [Desulfobacterota bacterium]|nr:type IV pilus assembly protein PilM [Thermodesulfobacteriota bacterium]
MPSKKVQWVGVDIGTQSIKIIVLEKKKNHWRLNNFQYRQFASVAEEDPVVYEKWIADTLTAAVAEMNIAGAWASSPLSGTQVALRKMTFPDIPLDEVKEAVRYQGKTVFPFVLDNAVIDVAQVGKYTDKEGPKQEVLVGAAIREQVQQRLNLLNQVNLRPHCLSLVPLALSKIYLLNKNRPPDESVALIDIGAHTSTIAMVQKEQVVFSREIGIGGETLTETLIDLSRLSHPGGMLSYAEAELIKQKYGVPLDEVDGEQTEEGIPLETIRDGFMPLIDRLIMEIDRSFGYFKTQAENQNIDRIFLSGGGSLLKGLSKAIERSFNLPTAYYEWGDSLEIDPAVDRETFIQQAPLFIIPLGLALDEKPAINLLPFARKSSRDLYWETGKKALVYGAIPLLFIGYLGYQVFGLYGDLSKINRTISQRQGELVKLEGPQSELGTLRKQEEELDRKLLDYPPQMIIRLPLQFILASISRTIPANMTLTDFSLGVNPVPGGSGAAPKAEEKGTTPAPAKAPAEKSGRTGTIELKGTVFGPGEEVLRSLDQWTRDLAEVKHFRDVRLLEVKQNNNFKSPAADFSVMVRLNH